MALPERRKIRNQVEGVLPVSLERFCTHPSVIKRGSFRRYQGLTSGPFRVRIISSVTGGDNSPFH